MGSSESRTLLDSSILLTFWRMPTKKDLTVFVTLRSSTDVFLCLPSLETSSPVLESIYQETSIRPEPSSTPSLTVGQLLMPSPNLVQIVAFVGALELFVMKDITGGEFVGDFRNDALDLG